MLTTGRRVLWIVAAAVSLHVAFLATPQAALAQECQADLQKMSQQREAQIAIVNGLVKAAKGKPLDAAVFCSKTGGLNAVESSMIAYMEKNKDWCSIPDDVVVR